jgi:hypothetical protein
MTRGEVLVLQVDRLARLSDRGEGQTADLVDARLVAPPGHGPGDPDLRRDQVGGDVRRPRIARRRRPIRPRQVWRRRGFAGGAPPALPRQVAERLGRRSVDHDHHLVPRIMPKQEVHDPAQVDLQVRRRVPTIDADVAAAAEGQLVVDHQHLLVMAGPERHRVVQPELDAAALEPLARLVREELLRGRDRQGRAPDQQTDVEFGPRVRQLDEDASHFVRIVRPLLAVREQPRARIEAPAQQDHRAPRPPQRLVDGGEVGLGVDQEGRPPRGLDTLAGLSGP